MILIDALIFIIIVGLLHYYKSTHPNFLFFCKGAVLFLPPDDEEQQQKQKQATKSKTVSKKQQKQGNEISILQVEYNQVKTYPFCTEYERIAMTVVSLLIFYVMRLALWFVLPEVSLLPFYVLCGIIVYTIKVSVDIFLVSAYRSKTCFMIALGVNVFYFFLSVSLGNMQGVYDSRIQVVSRDYAKHLQMVLGNNTINWINKHSVLGLVVIINFFITLAAIPSIVKFGNWYSKTLKEVYYQQDEEQQVTQRLLNSTKESSHQAQKKLKQHSKHTISLLNYYLIASLVFAFFSHRFVLTYVPQLIVDILRLLFLTLSVSIILWTAKDAMEFNGAIAYKFVLEYFKQKSKQGKLALRRKIVPYIYHIWYHFHQFMIRIIIPILLVYLVFHWKYLVVENDNRIDKSITERNVNYDIECSINTNELSLIKQLYKCPIMTYQQMEQEQNLQTYNIISGAVKGQSFIQSPAKLQEKVLSYGVLSRAFMVELGELLLWYANITIYSLTVVYVLFLRKTIYEI